MDRHETPLSPEWLRAASGSSSHSDGQSNGVLSRSRSSLNSADHDRGLHLTSSSSSYKRSVSINGSSAGRDRAYSSFGSRHRDRDRDRNKDRHRDIGRDYLLDDGYNDYFDPIRRSRDERDPLRRSRSVVTGVQGPLTSVPKRPGSVTSNGIGSSSRGISAFSFEKEFPSLGVEDKVGISDVGKASTPGIQGLSLGLPNGCTSALVAPSKDGSNGSQVYSGLQTAANMPSLASSTGTGLSMAEKLVQPPAPVQTAQQLPNDSERKKELEQLSKLIPVVKKVPVHNSSEKSKSKVTKISDYNASKISMQSTSQPVNRALRPPDIKPDVPKILQSSNYQVLNWEKNGNDSTAKDGQTSRIASLEALSPGSGGQAARNHHPKSTASQLKVNGKVGGERKPLPQSRGRTEFFNNIRKQEMSRNSSAVNLEANCVAPSSLSSSSSDSNLLVQSCEQIAGPSASHENDISAAAASSSDCSVAKKGKNDVCDEDPNEAEVAFMRSLGWKENATEEALTPEEIESFLSKHPALCACSKFKALIPELLQGGSS